MYVLVMLSIDSMVHTLFGHGDLLLVTVFVAPDGGCSDTVSGADCGSVGSLVKRYSKYKCGNTSHHYI